MKLCSQFFVYFRQLTYIKDCCDAEPEGDGVGALTTEERTRWAKVRATPPLKRNNNVFTIHLLLMVY